MEVQIKAVDSFSHDRLHAHIGRQYPVSKATADELVKAGLAEIVPDEDTAPQTGVTDSQQDIDDLIGGDKAEAAPENKMAPAPANKKAR